MTLSTHVLDTARGVPAQGVGIALFRLEGTERSRIAHAQTNADGRTDTPLAIDLIPGLYEIVFATEAYFARCAVAAFFTDIPVRFSVVAGAGRYHVPLLLAPWGYSTYRGS